MRIGVVFLIAFLFAAVQTRALQASIIGSLHVNLGTIPNATFPLDDSLKHTFWINNTGSQNLTVAVTALNSQGQMVPTYPQPGEFTILPHQSRHVTIIIDSGSGYFPEVTSPGGMLPAGNYTVPVRWEFANPSNISDVQTFNVDYHVRVIDPHAAYDEMQISGRVVDSSGNPMQYTNVQLWAMGAMGPYTSVAQSNGAFEFSVPRWSRYMLSISAQCVPRGSACYAPKYVFVNSSTSYYNITLYPVPYSLKADFHVTKRVNTTVGFWIGDASSNGQMILLSQGMEIWNSTPLKNISKLFLYTINGRQLWNYSMGWEAWGASLSGDGKYATYVTLQDTAPSFGLIDAATGHSIWVKTLANSAFPVPASINQVSSSPSPGAMTGYACRTDRISKTDKYIGLGCSNGVFYLVSLSNGTVIWYKYVVGQVRDVQFSADDQYVYVGSDPFLYKYSTSTGDMLWSADIWAWPLGDGLALSSDGSAIASMSKTGDVTVVNATTGNVIWRASTGGIGQWIAFSPDRSKVAGASFGGTWVFNASTGQPLWRSQSSKDARFSPDGDYLIDSGSTLYTASGLQLQQLVQNQVQGQQPSAPQGQPGQPPQNTNQQQPQNQGQTQQQNQQFMQLYMFAYMNPNDTRIVATFAGNGGYQNTGVLFFSGNITKVPISSITANQTGSRTTVTPQENNTTLNTTPTVSISQPVNQTSVNGPQPNIISQIINAIIKFFSSL